MKLETLFADTNLFLRYLTNDVPEQADAVERLLRRAAAGELRLMTSALVVGEIISDRWRPELAPGRWTACHAQAHGSTIEAERVRSARRPSDCG
ncbi:MAG: hypothetical protein ACUVSU_08040 [Aggregatilineaceae bacterium]